MTRGVLKKEGFRDDGRGRFMRGGGSGQRLEQYQDNQFCTVNSRYSDSFLAALIYTLRAAKLPFEDADVARIMEGWQELVPFPDALPGSLAGQVQAGGAIQRRERFPGPPGEESSAPRFRRRDLGRGRGGVQAESAGLSRCGPRAAGRAVRVDDGVVHSFDVVVAFFSGYRAAYVNRYDLPFEETLDRFDVAARDFLDLADKLGCALQRSVDIEAKRRTASDRQIPLDAENRCDPCQLFLERRFVACRIESRELRRISARAIRFLLRR